MIKSMTGFGRHKATAGVLSATVEIRSVNSKQLDLSLRMPSSLREFEYATRKHLSEAVERGKVDVYVQLEAVADAPAAPVLNAPLIGAYMEQLRALCPQSHPSEAELLAMALRLPEATRSPVEDKSHEEWAVVSVALEGALAAFQQFRLDEGQALATDLLTHVGTIEQALQGVPRYESERIQAVKERLLRGLEGMDYNHDRYEQELIHYLEKLDINEEKVRLQAHLDYFRTTLQEGHGRKLGFIAQEMGREINTLGSKANHAEMQKLVVGMKEDLEKIKEQVLNVY
jgi:uncharacterized protein (TIGR00255 family)